MTINKFLKWCIVVSLFLIPVTPYIVSDTLFFPFITGKVFFFRILVDIAFTLWLILALREKEYRPKFSWLWGIVTVFVVAMWFIDMFSAINSYKAMWSNFERMEGWWMLAHLWMFVTVLGSFFTTREWWKRWFAMSLIVSACISFIALGQAFFNSNVYKEKVSPSLTMKTTCEGHKDIPVGLCLTAKFDIHQGTTRVDGTLGNAAYLASYLLIHIFLAVYMMLNVRNWKKAKIWQWAFGILAVFEFIILIYTGTRGSMIGFIGGIGLVAVLVSIICTSKQEKVVRKWGIGSLVALVVLFGIFMSVRKTEFIQSHEVFARFANISIKDTKTQARAYIWPMALKGFKENPVLGWGQEGFNYVFNKYYDQRMYRQEQWFDRAHNVFLDWLIAGGIIGFGLYVSLYIFFLIYVWKSPAFSRFEKSLFTGLLSAYAVHNIFIFDNTVSYIMFFALLAFVHTEKVRERITPDQKYFAQWMEGKMQVDIQNLVAIPLIVIVGIGVLYKVNLVPINTSQALIQALINQPKGPQQNLEYFKQALAYDSMGKQEIREQLVTSAQQVIANNNVPIEIKNAFYLEARTEMEKQIAETPLDARNRLFFTDFLNQVGRLDPTLYPEALVQAQKALELSPGKQSIMVNLVLTYLHNKMYTEALTLAEKTYAEAPESESARDVYAISLVYNNKVEDAKKFYPQGILPLNGEMVGALASIKQFRYLINRYLEILKAQPNSFEIRLSLAAAHLALGENTTAISYVQDAVKVNPAFKDQAEAIIKEIRAGKNVLAQ